MEAEITPIALSNPIAVNKKVSAPKITLLFAIWFCFFKLSLSITDGGDPVSPTTRIALLYLSADFPEASLWLTIHFGKK
jgi:hypothetical protein